MRLFELDTMLCPCLLFAHQKSTLTGFSGELWAFKMTSSLSHDSQKQNKWIHCAVNVISACGDNPGVKPKDDCKSVSPSEGWNYGFSSANVTPGDVTDSQRWTQTQARVPSDFRTENHVQTINKSPLYWGIRGKVRKAEEYPHLIPENPPNCSRCCLFYCPNKPLCCNKSTTANH